MVFFFFCSDLQRQIEMSHNTKLNVFLLLKVSRDRMDSLISNEQIPQKKDNKFWMWAKVNPSSLLIGLLIRITTLGIRRENTLNLSGTLNKREMILDIRNLVNYI